MPQPGLKNNSDDALAELIRETSAVEIISIQERNPGPEIIREQIFKALAALQPGAGGIELNRPVKSMQNYAHRFRMSLDASMSFRVRPSAKKGWSKIWRIR